MSSLTDLVFFYFQKVEEEEDENAPIPEASQMYPNLSMKMK